MPDFIDVPSEGVYFWGDNGEKFHLGFHSDGGRLQIRLVDMPDGGSGRIFTHMPSGDVLLVDVQ